MPAAGADFLTELAGARQMPMVLSRSWLARPSSIHDVWPQSEPRKAVEPHSGAETNSFEQFVLPSKLRFRLVGEAAIG